VVVFESVSKHYQGKNGFVRALDDVSFRIEKGEFVVLRGPSGSGKTTLLVLLAGMLAPTGGKITVCGRRLTDLSSEDIARLRSDSIGFVFQMFHLLPYLNAYENVVLAIEKESIDSREVRQLLKRLDLENQADNLPSELSAGEKQRVAVARALVNRPRILLADEPTGNLDRENAQKVLSHLEDFHRQGGTVLVAGHSELAVRFADRVIELRSGRIVGNTVPPRSADNS